MIEGYKIGFNKADMDFSIIHGFLSSSYWAKGIPEETLLSAIENSLCFGVFTSSGNQIGFARVITDFATFGYLADVFILESYRGKGLCKWLMEVIVAHPNLQNFRRFILATRDAHGLYRKFGFKELSHPETFMESWQPNVYQNL